MSSCEPILTSNWCQARLFTIRRSVGWYVRAKVSDEKGERDAHPSFDDYPLGGCLSIAGGIVSLARIRLSRP